MGQSPETATDAGDAPRAGTRGATALNGGHRRETPYDLPRCGQAGDEKPGDTTPQRFKNVWTAALP